MGTQKTKPTRKGPHTPPFTVRLTSLVGGMTVSPGIIHQCFGIEVGIEVPTQHDEELQICSLGYNFAELNYALTV